MDEASVAQTDHICEAIIYLCFIQQNYLSQQINMTYRSKSLQNKPNTVLSIQTPSFLRSYQILEHQDFIALNRQSPEIKPLPSHKQYFSFRNIENHSQTLPEPRPLAKTKTAIHELQELMTPRSNNLTSFGRIVDNIKLTQSIQHKATNLQGNQVTYFNRENHGQEKLRIKDRNLFQNQKESLQRVNILLEKQSTKQREIHENIVYLQNKIDRVQEEKAQTQFLLRKLQHQYSTLQQKYKEVEDKLKKRVIVNLELEALMVSINIKHNQKLNELKTNIANLQSALSEKDKEHQAKIKKMKEQFDSSKRLGQQQIDALISQLSKRSNELAELKSKQKTNIFDSEPIFDKFGVSTKNSNYFIEAPFPKSQPKQKSKNNGSLKPMTTTNSLVPQYPQIRESGESPEPKLKFQSLNLQNFSFGKNRPLCISERT